MGWGLYLLEWCEWNWDNDLMYISVVEETWLSLIGICSFVYKLSLTSFSQKEFPKNRYTHIYVSMCVCVYIYIYIYIYIKRERGGWKNVNLAIYIYIYIERGGVEECELSNFILGRFYL